MKKIINNRKYDTETAKALGMCSHEAMNDFHHYTETLYRKKTGEYFLYGEGNAASKYREQVFANEWGPGWEIIPLTEAEAQEWAVNHLDCDEYEAIFGEVAE